MQLRHIVLIAALGMAHSVAVASEYVGARNADSLFHGQGTYRDDAGSVYTGEWRDGMRHGQGTMTWANGDKYEGSFANDMRDGQGTLVKADGTRYSGTWSMDQLQGDITVAYSNGSQTIGKVESLLFDAPSSRLVDRDVNLGPVPAKRVAANDSGSDAVTTALREMQSNPPAAGRSDAVALTIKSSDQPRFALDKAVKAVVGDVVGQALFAARAPEQLNLHVSSPLLGVEINLTGYRGPGQYFADSVKVSFSEQGKTYATPATSVPPAAVAITYDDGKIIKGTLRVTTFRDGVQNAADRREIQSAEFVLPVR